MTSEVPMSEADLQAAVIALARLMSWKVAHFRPAQNSKGIWRTPVAADGAGFPDLILVRPGMCIAVELKSSEGTVKPEQRAWINAFESAGISAFVWRPEHWTGGQILQVLQQVPVTSQ
jgi:VRR-NUC domain